ncbi:hypothetical protein [Pseudomonas oligotrophica]|uniref:hypothetical protein n=1 Tax=Pseudomonas oligotrophica TaxID=2912055 RepID=UPI001F48167B|nr:hypothetical protein [Pseudomonas oligotrophica]MCF7201389.1 hypothetical protein [Pseudomonas oligotrophica]
MYRASRFCALLVGLSLGVDAFAAALPEAIGLVRAVDGLAVFSSRGHEAPAQVGQALVVGATLSTAAGSLGLALVDGTRLVLGPHSRLQLETFRFAPAAGELAFRARLQRGSLYAHGGELARLGKGAWRIETAGGEVSLDGEAAVLVRAGR